MDYCEQLKVVTAKAPNNPDETVELSVDINLIRQIAASKLTDKLFDYSYLVCGVPPQVNNIGYHERAEDKVIQPESVLNNPVKIYQGLERPFIDDGLDQDIYIYVSNPKLRYKYIPDMVCVAKRAPAPNESVFVVYVKLGKNGPYNGAIIGWEWVVADSKQTHLPDDYESRYDKEVY